MPINIIQDKWSCWLLMLTGKILSNYLKVWEIMTETTDMGFCSLLVFLLLPSISWSSGCHLSHSMLTGFKSRFVLQVLKQQCNCTVRYCMVFKKYVDCTSIDFIMKYVSGIIILLSVFVGFPIRWLVHGRYSHFLLYVISLLGHTGIDYFIRKE